MIAKQLDTFLRGLVRTSHQICTHSLAMATFFWPVECNVRPVWTCSLWLIVIFDKFPSMHYVLSGSLSDTLNSAQNEHHFRTTESHSDWLSLFFRLREQLHSLEIIRNHQLTPHGKPRRGLARSKTMTGRKFDINHMWAERGNFIRQTCGDVFPFHLEAQWGFMGGEVWYHGQFCPHRSFTQLPHYWVSTVRFLRTHPWSNDPDYHKAVIGKTMTLALSLSQSTCTGSQTYLLPENNRGNFQSIVIKINQINVTGKSHKPGHTHWLKMA